MTISPKKPVIIAISGVKNSGKTTLIEALLPRLSQAGLDVAVIKHDGHRFVPEDVTTDTGRHFAAGAMATAIFDGETCKIVRRGCYDVPDLIPLFPEADLILLEGFKHSHYPKLELVRAGNSAQSVCPTDTLLALVTDLPIALPGMKTIPFGDVAQVAKLVIDYVGQKRNG